ncbi:DNA-binding Lrp family transcriptional regulator [Jatrophihabitans sp. GAS493]|uniref:Lrp/AsnC family transcriptional regulator n=1 Tax=Jatrophihabitans sp. GAS493 TaxID=1907575 RepID=UPI000BB9719B|nr:AsnC family transcriptional regulator [Jatrophihabitans sp. GAS493]SOD70924.1 DNA-binding Lrp family transcriptional regulator [Jatrophihabitans sp. GAS493]
MVAPRSGESINVDELDRLIIHAIQVACRAPFALIAEVVGVSEQTVARRYRRLESAGVLRVIGLARADAAGLDRWMLRIQCRPDAAGALAEALARRPDISWISLSAGGSEIVCHSHTARGQDGPELLLQRLPQTAQVQRLSAHAILHQFDAGAEWGGYGPGLSPDAKARLRAADSPFDETGRDLLDPEPGAGLIGAEPIGAELITAEDERLIAALGRDGRASLRSLAAATRWSPTRVGRRIERLERAGALYFDVDLDIERLGFASMTHIWVTVAPSDLEAVGREFVTHDEIAFCAAVTGSANLVLVVICRNATDLYRYVTTRVGAMAAVRQIETSPVLRRVKQAGSLMTRRGIARPAP